MALIAPPTWHVPSVNVGVALLPLVTFQPVITSMFARVRTRRLDLAGPRNIGALVKAVAGAEIAVVVIAGDGQVLAAEIERAANV